MDRIKNNFFVKFVTSFFPPPRQTEPKYFYPFRVLFKAFVYGACLYYFISQSQDLADAKPQIQTSISITDIPAPGVLFGALFNFTINCFYLNENNLPSNSVDCQSRLSRINSTDPSNLFTEYVFNTTTPKLMMSDTLAGIYFEIFTNNTANDTLPVVNTNVKIIVADMEAFLPTGYFGGNSGGSSKFQNIETASYIRYIFQNLYVLSQKQRNIIWFDRSNHKDIDSYSIKGLSGLTAKGIQTSTNYHTIESRIQVVNPLNLSSFTPYATIEIYNQSTLETFDEEVQNTSYLTVLSSLGGAWSLGMSIYALCFGAESISPLGLPLSLSRFVGCGKQDEKQEIVLNNDRVKVLLQDYVIDLGDIDAENLSHIGKCDDPEKV